MAAVVTLNSIGAKATAQAVTTLNPVPPISNCLGKMVFLLCAANQSDVVNAPTGATYFLLGSGAVDSNFRVYYKNGEAVEPTPTVNFTDNSGGGKIAQILVLDIAGGTFPVVASAGDARLATGNTRDSGTGITYGALTVVGGGYAIQFGMRVIFSGNCTSIATTAAFTQIAFGASSGNATCIVAQLQDAATVFGANLPQNNNVITSSTDSTSNQAHSLTVEMAVTQAAGRRASGMDGGMQDLTGGLRG